MHSYSASKAPGHIEPLAKAWLARLDAEEVNLRRAALEQARHEATDRISAAAIATADNLTGPAARTLQQDMEAKTTRLEQLAAELEEAEAAVRAALDDADAESLSALFHDL